MYSKGIDIVLTLYKPTKRELKYWSNVQKTIHKKSDSKVYVLVDGTNLNLGGFHEEYTYKSDYNVGKLRLVNDFIRKDIIKKTHFKIFDPDDYIDIANFRGIKIKNEHIGNIILTPYIMNKKGNKIFSESNIFYTKRNFPNNITILPTDNTKDSDKFWNEIRIDFADDQILAFIAISNGAKIITEDWKFYLYNVLNGVTNPNNIKKTLSFVYEAYEKLFEYSKIKSIDISPICDIGYFEKLTDLFFANSTEHDSKDIYEIWLWLAKLDNLIKEVESWGK